MASVFVDPSLSFTAPIPISTGEDEDTGEPDEYGGVPRTRDVEVRAAPLLLDDIPEELGADDGAQQHIILDSLRDSAGDLDERAACYEDAPVKQVLLSKLQSYWENKKVTSAFRLLRSRSEIVIDDEFKCDPHDKNLAYNLSQHRLDFLLVMSNRIGFDAILPNSRSDTTFIFRLDLHQPQRSLKLKHSNLGFPMDHKALFIGRARGKDLVYLVMAPNAFIAQEEDDADDMGDPAPSKGRIRTNMSGRHYWMLVMYMAFIFEKHFPHRDVYCHESYPNVDQNAWENVRAATNIMNQPDREFTHRELRTYDVAFREEWPAWVAASPAHWCDDRFIVDNSPLTVSNRYGQDERFGDLTTLIEDAAAWNAERDYQHCRTLFVAIATHLSAITVGRWIDIPTDTLERHGPLYDSVDPVDQVAVDLDHLAMTDDEGREIPVFSAAGRRVMRRTPQTRAGAPKCAILVDFTNARDLFEDPSGIDYMADFQASPPPNIIVNAFRQSYFKSAGHLQVDAVPFHMRALIANINTQVAIDAAPEDAGYYGEELPRPLPMTAVSGVDCQMYNSVMHRVRGSASNHDAQRGDITAAFAGSYSQGASQKTTAKRLFDACSVRLPHQNFSKIIEHPGLDKSLRMECVHKVDLTKLKPEQRLGSSIYLNILVPIANTWSDPAMLEILKGHLLVLSGKVYPQCIEWATFGVVSLLEILWASQKAVLQQGARISPYMVELASVLERTLNVAHTGNVRVIATTLMNPLWVGRSLIDHGTPTFDECVQMDLASKGGVRITDVMWPRDQTTREPFTASKRSQIFNYGPEQWEMFAALHRMQFLSVTMPKDWYPQHRVHTRRCFMAAQIAVTSYIADVKLNVKALVESMVNEGLESYDTEDQHAATERRRYIRRWLRSEFPLSYGAESYPPLLRAITPAGSPHSLPMGNEESMSILELSAIMYDIARPNRPIAVQAPVIARSPSLSVLRVAVEYMASQAFRGQVADIPSFIKHILAQTFEDHRVVHVPWSAPPTLHAAGRPPRKVNFAFWRSAGKDLERGQRAMIGVINAEEHAEKVDANIAREASRLDGRSPWALRTLTIGELPSIQHKQSLPIDFLLAHASLSPNDEHVSPTYNRVYTHYDGASPIHKFALLVAHIFSRLAPNLSHPPKPASMEALKGNARAITSLVRNAPWIPDPKDRRGVTATEPFIVMVTTYIIAMVDDQSPLRLYMERHMGSQGDAWTKKHSGKFISAFNLVRLGIAEAHSAAIYRSPKHGPTGAWAMKPTYEIKAFAQRFLQIMKSQPYGPYQATKLVFGVDAANLLAMDSYTGVSQYTSPGLPQTIQPAARRPRSDAQSEDGEEDMDSPHPSKKRLRR